MVLQNFETHYTNDTHGSLHGGEHSESELIEALHIVPRHDDGDETDDDPVRSGMGEDMESAIQIDE